jgi:hypothetical protein
MDADTLADLSPAQHGDRFDVVKEACWYGRGVARQAQTRRQEHRRVDTCADYCALTPPLVLFRAISNATSGGNSDQLDTIMKEGGISAFCTVLRSARQDCRIALVR